MRMRLRCSGTELEMLRSGAPACQRTRSSHVPSAFPRLVRRLGRCKAVQPATPDTEKLAEKRKQASQSLSSSSLTSVDLPANMQELCISAENNSMPGSNGKAKFLEASICRLYYFSKDQLNVVQELVGSMKNSKIALTSLAVANILLSLAQASGFGHHHHTESIPSAVVIADSGLTVGDVAYWADSLMVAFLISYAIGPFEQVLKSRSNQMAYTFQGLNRLSLIFQQLAVGSIAVSTVTGLEAAAKYPPLVVGTSAVFFGVAGTPESDPKRYVAHSEDCLLNPWSVALVVRSAAMWWTLSRHAQNNEEVSKTLMMMREPSKAGDSMGILDRWATFLAFGYLLQFEQKESPLAAQSLAPAPAAITSGAAQSSGAEGRVDMEHYEFSLAEERLLRGLTEATSTAGLALGLQAFVTLMLTIADFGIGDMPEMIGNGINATNKAILTYLLFSACSAYDRALHTAGSDDVQHLMDGLGHKGLTGLFESLAVLSYAITIATLAGLALPYIEENMVAKLMGDGLSHRSAEYFIEALEYLIKIMRGF